MFLQCNHRRQCQGSDWCPLPNLPPPVKHALSLLRPARVSSVYPTNLSGTRLPRETPLMHSCSWKLYNILKPVDKASNESKTRKPRSISGVGPYSAADRRWTARQLAWLLPYEAASASLSGRGPSADKVSPSITLHRTCGHGSLPPSRDVVRKARPPPLQRPSRARPPSQVHSIGPERKQLTSLMLEPVAADLMYVRCLATLFSDTIIKPTKAISELAWHPSIPVRPRPHDLRVPQVTSSGGCPFGCLLNSRNSERVSIRAASGLSEAARRPTPCGR